jgi:hypothetical protein
MKTNNLEASAKQNRMSLQESAAYRTRLDAVMEAGAIQITREQQELMRRGILDAEGNRIEAFVPPTDQDGLDNEIYEPDLARADTLRILEATKY